MKSMKDLKYHIGFKVKLYPSHLQKRIIAINDGAKRAVYNFLVACNNEKYVLSRADLSCYKERLEYIKQVLKNTSEMKNVLPFLYEEEVDSQAIANAIQNYQTAWKNRKERHSGIPTFKKKSNEQSYQTNAHYYMKKDNSLTSNVRFEDKKHVTLPKLGRIRIGASPKIIEELLKRNDVRIGSIAISKDAVGEYWASFSLASDEPFHKALPKTGRKQGIDLNLLDLFNTSDGESYKNKRFYKDSQEKLTKQQRKLSRMQEHAKKKERLLRDSKNYQKQRRKVAYLHRKIARQREHYLHELSKHEIENQDFIVAEELKVQNLLKNKKLAKSISDAGWRTFLTMLKYKSELYDKTVVFVPPQYTTQTCSHCGHIMKGEQKLTLGIREWECPICHAKHQRDVNAAKNILQRGLQLYQEVVPI